MKGLLLVGGKSSRMGADKSELVLRDGLSQRERGIQLLGCVCNEVYVSTREESGAENTIADAFGSIGPLGAIASAQQNDPDSAWLVLACDLPLLEQEHLTNLTNSRDTKKDATCFTSATDGLPEPLCAIWEPSSMNTVRESLDAGKRCPRSLLLSLETNSPSSPGLWPLANTNTKADLLEIKARLNKSTLLKTISVSYFAQLRELTGTSSETIKTDSETPAGLFEEIRAKHSIPLKRKGMMVAVNGDFTDWSHPLAEGEDVVFIPPVAGG